MWNEQFLFVLSALFAIGMWIALALKRNAQRSRKSRKFANYLSYAIATASVLIIVIHFMYYLRLSDWKLTSLSFPGVGSILAIMLGGIVGSFSAKFVWSFFGARFGTRDPSMGALVLMVLIIVYSLPIYQREVSTLLAQVGLSSLKTPFVELSFAENSQFRGATFSAIKPSAGDEHPSAIARPSYPRPGLERLKEVVSDDELGDLTKDDRYITFFAGETPMKLRDPKLNAKILIETREFLKPIKGLAGCLLAYVDIFPDSQLLLVDIKPIIQWFFRLHGNAVKAVSDGSIELFEPNSNTSTIRADVAAVRKSILIALGLPEGASDVELRKRLRSFRSLAKWTAKKSAPGESDKEIDDFVEQCGAQSPAMAPPVSEQRLNYLQPYITIALANLLVAHGSPDEAIDVLAQWLDLWRCARGEGPEGKFRARNCSFGPVLAAADLHEWLSIRAEFELNVLLYRMAGEQNITYRDFLTEHAKHFSDFVERPEKYAAPPTGSRNSPASPVPPITIRGELERCVGMDRATLAEASPKNERGEPIYRAVILRSLSQNEETLLRSEVHFLGGKTAANWADLENLRDRSLLLTRFTFACIYPEGQPDETHWRLQLASYRITHGLVALAIAQRLAVNAGSSDQRYRAEEIPCNCERDIAT